MSDISTKPPDWESWIKLMVCSFGLCTVAVVSSFLLSSFYLLWLPEKCQMLTGQSGSAGMLIAGASPPRCQWWPQKLLPLAQSLKRDRFPVAIEFYIRLALFNRWIANCVCQQLRRQQQPKVMMQPGEGSAAPLSGGLYQYFPILTRTQGQHDYSFYFL